MHSGHQVSQSCAGPRIRSALSGFTIALVLAAFSTVATAGPTDAEEKLKGFDQYMDKVLKEWNVAGACVGVIVKDKLVFAKGYGYRDYDKKLSVTSNTLF